MTGFRPALLIGAATAACALMAGCGQGGPKPKSADELPQSDYAVPPEPKAAAPGAAGAVVLSGASRPGALIRLASPDGSAIGATASESGAWTLEAPTGGEPKLYSLSEDAGGRALRARGYILALPSGAAAILRPGAPAQPLAVRRGLQIAAVDFDASGAAVASGAARPGETVRLLLDGAEAGEDRGDSKGGFAVSLSRTLRPGPHALTASTSSDRAEVSFDASPTTPMARPPYSAARMERGWRVDWSTPGGGIQTTILFDPVGGGA